MMNSNSKLTTFYIIRHGQTDWNVKKLIQGHTDIPLNSEGEKQAIQLSQKLSLVRFDKVFSSDLLRAHKTAEIALIEKNITIETTNLLRERCFGKIEGKTTQLIHDLEEVLKQMTEQQRKDHKPNPEFESDNEVISRVITFLREVATAYPTINILISSHGGIIRLLLAHFGLIKIDQMPLIENGCYLKITSDGTDFFVEELNGIDLDKKYE